MIIQILILMVLLQILLLSIAIFLTIPTSTTKVNDILPYYTNKTIYIKKGKREDTGSIPNLLVRYGRDKVLHVNEAELDSVIITLA